MCPAKSGSRDFGESEVFDLPGSGTDEDRGLWTVNHENHSLDELGHLSDGVFDGDRGVSVVGVIEVDIIDSQSRKRLVEGLLDILRVGLHKSISFSMSKAELGSEEDLITLSSLLKPVLPNRGAGTK